MKRRVSNEQGGALLVVLISSIIMGISLASFLKYTATQARSIKFSQTWNSAIPVAEAGVEEALAHINDSTIGTNFAINGWTLVSGQFQKSATMSGGRYICRISPDKWPIITCAGYTVNGRKTNEYVRTVQVTTTRAGTGMKGIVAKGDVIMNGITEVDSFDSEDERYATRGRYDPAKRKDGGYVASVEGSVTGTTVYGTVGTGPLGTATGNVGTFDWLGSGNTGIQPGAYANDVNMSFGIVQQTNTGNPPPLSGVTMILTNFAFWSTQITSTNYPSPMPPSGVVTNVAGTGGGSNIVLWPSYPSGIMGFLITTNWTTVTLQKTLPTNGVYKNIVKHNGRYDYDLLTSYSYPCLTYTYSLTATNYDKTTNTYTYAMTDSPISRAECQLTNLRLSGGDKMIVMATNAILYIRDDFSMSGSSEIIIAPGGSLKMYVGGSVSLSGNGIFNYTLDASKFSLFGLPSCRDISISGNAAFTGVIYAPSANVTMNGGGTDIYDIVGAIVSNSATMNGHFQFHYDERLGRAKILAKYTVASWKEL